MQANGETSGHAVNVPDEVLLQANDSHQVANYANMSANDTDEPKVRACCSTLLSPSSKGASYCPKEPHSFDLCLIYTCRGLLLESDFTGWLSERSTILCCLSIPVTSMEDASMIFFPAFLFCLVSLLTYKADQPNITFTLAPCYQRNTVRTLLLQRANMN